MVIARYRRGELHSPSHDTDKFPYGRAMAFVIHVTDALAPNLNGYFWEIGDWNNDPS